MAGGVLVLLAVLCWCGGSFATRWLPMPADPFVASVYEMAAGGVALVVIVAVLTRESPHLGGVRCPGPRLAGARLPHRVRFADRVHRVRLAAAHAPISLVATYAYVNPIIALLARCAAGRRGRSPHQVLLAAATVVRRRHPRRLHRAAPPAGRSLTLSYRSRQIQQAQLAVPAARPAARPAVAEPFEQTRVDRVEERRAGRPVLGAVTRCRRAAWDRNSRRWARVSPTKNSRRSSATVVLASAAARAAAAAAGRPRSRRGTRPATPGPWPRAASAG